MISDYESLLVTPPLAIFDIDGTLIDSRKMITLAMQDAFRAEGYAVPDYNIVRSIVGLSLEVAIGCIAPDGLGPQAVGALVAQYKKAFVHLRDVRKVSEPLYSGGRELLLRLKQAGWKMGVATGKSRRGLDAMITSHDFGHIFDCHFCADDGPGKPDPFMVEANLRALNISPRHAVIIGDTHFDMTMGKRAGVHALGVNWGFHTEAEIRSGGADKIVASMTELDAYLRQFAQRQAA